MPTKVKQDAKLQEKQVAEAMAEILSPEKSRHGGRRRGAGRKPNFLKRSGLPPVTANVILGNFDVVRLWGSLLNSKDEDIRLRCICYLTNREQGCPQTSVEINPGEGEIIRLLNAGRDRLARERAEQKPSKPVPEPEIHVPARPQLHCSRHGDYPKPYFSKAGNMCPECIAEAELAEKRLNGMLPVRGQLNGSGSARVESTMILTLMAAAVGPGFGSRGILSVIVIFSQLGSGGQEVVRHCIVPDGYAVRAAPIPLPSPAFFGARRISFDIRSRNLSGQGMFAIWTAGRRAFPETTTTFAG